MDGLQTRRYESVEIDRHRYQRYTFGAGVQDRSWPAPGQLTYIHVYSEKVGHQYDHYQRPRARADRRVIGCVAEIASVGARGTDQAP